MYMFHRSFSDGKPINLPESVAKKIFGSRYHGEIAQKQSLEHSMTSQRHSTRRVPNGYGSEIGVSYNGVPQMDDL